MPSCTITASSTVTAHIAKASVTSFSSSLVYMKRVLPVAITNIVFNRLDFDSKFFTPHIIKDTPYMTLRHGLPKRSELMSLYRQLQDAVVLIDKNCLDELYLIFIKKETKDLIEHYRFQIIYNPEDDGDMPTGVAVLEDTSNLFRNINSLSKSNKIDWNGIEISMQLNLNKEVPVNYTSRQFEKSNPLITSLPEKYTDIAYISTGYHKMILKARGNIFPIADNNLVENEVEENIPDTAYVEENASFGNDFDIDQSKLKKDEKKTTKQKRKTKKQKITKESLNAENEMSSAEVHIERSRKMKRQKKENNEKQCNGFDDESEINITPRKKRSTLELGKEPSANLNSVLQNDKETSNIADQPDHLSNDVGGVSVNDSVEFVETNEVQIKCTCNVNYLLDSIDLITCAFCKTNQHVACNGYKKASAIPIPYLCHECQPTSEFESVDVRMHLKKKSNQKSMFALLRLLCLYYNTHKEVQMVINKLPLPKKNDIIRKLTEQNVIYMDDSGKYTCSDVFVNNMIKSYYFYPDIKQDTMDSMVLE